MRWLLLVICLLPQVALAAGAGELAKAVQTACGCIVDHVQVGDPNNRATWIVTYDPSATATQQTAGNAAIASFDMTAPSPAILSFTQFMALFTSAEQTMIVNSADTGTKLFLLQAAGSGRINLGDPQVAAGLNYIATPSPGPALIAPSRVQQILANQAP